MSTSSPPRRNSRTERIIAWTILLLVLAALGAFMAHFAWVASTSPIIVMSVTR
ncbi:MAG TPA: hypothetical protein VLJ14_00005 [Ktedonobacterales bacterium]|jgi:hypothetical protein|nr:hypothetical protein [Ktedonobacterales bacterium]